MTTETSGAYMKPEANVKGSQPCREVHYEVVKGGFIYLGLEEGVEIYRSETYKDRQKCIDAGYSYLSKLHLKHPLRMHVLKGGSKESHASHQNNRHVGIYD